MEKFIVERWEANKDKIRAAFENAHPDEYIDIVRVVVTHVGGNEYDVETLDPNRIHVIDDGAYQGTLVFVIAETGYQPSKYWYVKIGYGSCSGCDTLRAIRQYDYDKPTVDQVDKYMTLALHIVQGLKRMDYTDI